MFGRARRPAPPPVRLRVRKLGTNSWSLPWVWTLHCGDSRLEGDFVPTHAQALTVGLAALEHATLRRTAA